MSRFFITSRENVKLKDLLKENLKNSDADTIIEAGGSWLNSKTRLTDPDFIIKKNTTIRVYTSPNQGKRFELDKRDIVYENKSLLIVFKPWGLNVHSVPATMHYNLNYGVNEYLKSIGIRYESVPVTRLDRLVGGLVIFPKNKGAEKELFRKIQDRVIHKWYITVLEGEFYKPCVRIKNKIINKGSFTEESAEGKFADSLFIKKSEKEGLSFASVFIFTGRRHQIRFHSSLAAGPVAGDKLYKGEKAFVNGHVALMCRGYNFMWKGKKIRARADKQSVKDFSDRFFI